MKKLLLLPLLFLLGCANNGANEHANDLAEDVLEVDTVLENSQKHLDTATLVYHQSDSIAKDQVVKIVKEISYLNTEVEKYKEVLSKQTIATEKIVYKIDTVYIETKKNFWGKEKTNTTIKSDSIVTEKIDTTEKSGLL